MSSGATPSPSTPQPSVGDRVPNRTIQTLSDSGLVKYSNRDYIGAIVDYTQTIQLKPDYATVYYNHGNAKERLLQFSEQRGHNIMSQKKKKQNGKSIFRGFTNPSS